MTGYLCAMLAFLVLALIKAVIAANEARYPHEFWAGLWVLLVVIAGGFTVYQLVTLH